MATRKGQIAVETKDIFPIIKKWLYSEHDIFLRELVSNACDAITKRAGLSRGQNVEVPNGAVTVVVDTDNKLIHINDNGVGMTEEEVEKYIANLAFSGAEEFAKKMQDIKSDVSREDIIGKFGLGFYSAFMVADKVVVDSLSMQKGAKPVAWTCEGETEYEFSAGSRAEVGTTITLHINEESAEFLQAYKTRAVLARYCDFMPYPIELRDLAAEKREAETEAKNKADAEKNGNEYVAPEKTQDIINQTNPLWKVDPTAATDEDYKHFFQKMFPMEPEPLFWIHLNVDHPFELQGILYFPKLNPHKPLQENNIKLYSKQVFVSDNVKNIIPDFLGLLKGVIDSTDIPLNVSRSSLQGDPNIKKISNYIVKKVADALKKLYRSDREKFERIWPDISLFVKYGSLGDTKFDDLMRPFVLFKNSDEKLVTLDEYRESIPAEYKEKLGDKVLTYEKDGSDTTLVNQLKAEGLMVLETDNVIDPHFTQHCEIHQKGDSKFTFAPIDAEVENLLSTEANEEQDKEVQSLFNEVFEIKEDDDNKSLAVEVKGLKNSTSPAYFKIDHQMKRFQDMTKAMGQTPFESPIKKTLVVNPNNPLVQNALKLWQKNDKKELAKKICHHVQDLASISGEGLEAGQKDAFIKRSQDLISELSSLAL